MESDTLVGINSKNMDWSEDIKAFAFLVFEMILNSLSSTEADMI